MLRFKLQSTIIDEAQKRKKAVLVDIDDINSSSSSSSSSGVEWCEDDDNIKREIPVSGGRKKRKKHASKFSAPILWAEIRDVNEDERSRNWSFYQRQMEKPIVHLRWYISCSACDQDVQYKGRSSIEKHIFSKRHQVNTGQKKRKIGILVVDEKNEN